MTFDFIFSKVLGGGILFGFACQSLTVLILLTRKPTPTSYGAVLACMCVVSTLYTDPLCCGDRVLL